jgi:hypothetical protein
MRTEDGRADRRIYMTELTVAFCKFAKAPEKRIPHAFPQSTVPILLEGLPVCGKSLLLGWDRQDFLSYCLTELLCWVYCYELYVKSTPPESSHTGISQVILQVMVRHHDVK